MDPVSATANIIAIVGIACKSCQALHGFFRGISEASDDIKQYCATLRSLKSTLQCMKSLITDPTIGQHLLRNVGTSLEECSIELQSVDEKCRKAQKAMQQGKVRNSVTRLGWYLSGEHSLDKFFARLQRWYTVFSLELSTLQIQMLVWNRSDILSLKATNQLPARTCLTRAPMTARSSLNRESSMAEEILCEDAPGSVAMVAERACPPLQAPIHTAEAPVMYRSAVTQQIDTGNASGVSCSGRNQFPSPDLLNLRSHGIYTFHIWLGSLCWTFRPAVTKSQQINQKDSKAQAHCSGLGLKLTARLLRIYVQTVMVQICYQKHLGTSSLHCSVAFANVIPKNSRVMDIVRVGDPENLGKLFETGEASYSDTAPDGTSLLHIAASEGHLDVLRYLIACGADPEVMDDDGDTPLHLSVARSDDYNVTRTLMESGADINIRNAEGKTPLHTFFREGNRTLFAGCKNTLEFDIQDNQGLVLLHYIAWSSKSKVTDIQQLISGDVSRAFTKDNDGRSLLFFAAERGNLEILEYLLSLPKRPELTDIDSLGMSLMHYAVRSKRVQAINLLYDKGCPVRIIDHNRQTALHHSVKRGNLEAVKRLLLLDGHDVLAYQDSHGRTPLDLARRSNGAAIIAYVEAISPCLAPTASGSRPSKCLLDAEGSLPPPTLGSRWGLQIVAQLRFWQLLSCLAIFILLFIGYEKSPLPKSLAHHSVEM